MSCSISASRTCRCQRLETSAPSPLRTPSGIATLFISIFYLSFSLSLSLTLYIYMRCFIYAFRTCRCQRLETWAPSTLRTPSGIVPSSRWRGGRRCPPRAPRTRWPFAPVKQEPLSDQFQSPRVKGNHG